MEFNFKNTTAAKQRLQERATGELWRRGEAAKTLLKGGQVDLYNEFMQNKYLMHFFLCSRRFGKTVSLLTIAVSECFRTPGTRVLFLSKTTDQVTEIIDQTAEAVLESCPPELQPKLKVKANKWVFHNGSEIRVKGIDKVGGNALRGVKANLVILDEACFMENLSSAINSVLMPMVIATNGRILFGSTPPDSAGHDSIQFIAKCEEKGALTRKTIYDMENILYNRKQIEMFEEESGGKDSTLFRREYMAEIVTEKTLAIVPGFKDAHVQTPIFPTDRKDETPYWPDTYVSLDLGFRDLTVALFGYWDYPHARLVIQDELVFDGTDSTTENVALSVIEKERELWGSKPPKIRVSDVDPRFIEDLKTLHNLRFKPTAKLNKEASINQLNILVNSGCLLIDPKCRTLIKHLKYGLWKENRTAFQRTKELGHCDAIDALIYMVRNINKSSNPVPHEFYHPGQYVMHDWGAALNSQETTLSETFKKLFA